MKIIRVYDLLSAVISQKIWITAMSADLSSTVIILILFFPFLKEKNNKNNCCGYVKNLWTIYLFIVLLTLEEWIVTMVFDNYRLYMSMFSGLSTKYRLG